MKSRSFSIGLALVGTLIVPTLVAPSFGTVPAWLSHSVVAVSFLATGLWVGSVRQADRMMSIGASLGHGHTLRQVDRHSW